MRVRVHFGGVMGRSVGRRGGTETVQYTIFTTPLIWIDKVRFWSLHDYEECHEGL